MVINEDDKSLVGRFLLGRPWCVFMSEGNIKERISPIWVSCSGREVGKFG